MKSKIMSLFFALTLISTLSGCLLQSAGPDQELPQYSRPSAAAPSTTSGRLIKVEYEELLDVRGTYRHQEYSYDGRGRLMSIYAPEGYLPCVSEIPYTWLLYDHADVIEERYEYDAQDRLSRVSGYLPAELTGNALSYEITMEYDAAGHVIQETLTDASGESTVSLEYDGGLVRRVTSSDGRSAELYHENAELVRIVLPDGKITYSRETGEVLVPTESGVAFADGYTVTKVCTGPRAYSEEDDYTADGNLISRARDYEDDPQNLYYWYYTYS